MRSRKQKAIGLPNIASKRALSRKQKKLVVARALDPEATLEEIGILSAYKQPRQSAHRELQKPHILAAVAQQREKLRHIMEQREKLSLDALLTKLEEGLESVEIKSLELEGTDFKVKTAVADFAARYKYWLDAMKLHGLLGNI